MSRRRLLWWLQHLPVGWERRVRDVLVMGLGTTLVLTQVVVQFRCGEVSEAMLIAGFGAIMGLTVIRLGDRKSDNGKSQNSNNENSH